MKRIVFSLFAVLRVALVFSQNDHVYEMSMNSYNVGYYYIEYTDKPFSDTDSVVVQFFDETSPCNNLHVKFMINADTISATTNKQGIVYLNIGSLDSSGILKILVKSTNEKIRQMEKCIYFWEWSGKNHPLKIYVYVEHIYSSIVHIRSKKSLSTNDIENIKNSLLATKKNKNIRSDIEIKVLEYF